jgi:hypothetical protein
MIYRDRLSPWCVIQHLPKLQRATIARFRKRNDAEEYVKALRRMNPAIAYEIIFDPPDLPRDDVSGESSAIVAIEPPFSLGSGIN